LLHYGIRGLPHDLIKSYLENRQQFVTYNKHESPFLPIITGVPQGSVLGPLLFLIYINDISYISNYLSFFLFADDTTILKSGVNLCDMQVKINEELDILDRWLKINKLSINTDKTKFMIFGPKRKRYDDINIKICNRSLDRVSSITFLGVDIDSDLSWKTHISKIHAKIASVIGVLCKIRYKINKQTALLIYDALILSQLNYCNLVWGSTYKTSLNNLFILQKRALKICLRLDRKTATNLVFQEARKLTIYDINKLQLAIFVYSLLNCKLPIIFNSYLHQITSIHSHNTRSNINIFIHSVKNNLRKFSVKGQGPLIWNSLPLDLRLSTSLPVFKKSIKKYLMSINYPETESASSFSL